MKEKLLRSSVIHADETVVQVLREPNRKAQTDSRMWVYCAGKYEEHSNILFEYSPTRNGENARNFLGAYSGYVVCDGYDGYNKLTEAIRCGCWAHARRKFVEALPTDRSLLANSVAAKGVELCNEIFLLEREFEGKDGRGAQIKKPLTATEKHEQRQERLKPVLDGLFAWLNEIPVSGGTKPARAVQYCLNEKQYLCRCLENGNIPVDNNRAENAIRPFVVGRKNWLFANSVKGAEASAVVYSLAEWIHVTVNGETLTCTPEHPFYVPEKGWTSAIDLRAGDILVMLNGEYVVVEQVQHELLESPETTYNFEVEDYHTYYVGEDQVLVHNECKPKSAGNMQKQVEAGQAPKGVAAVHKAHTLPHGKPHVHFSDGTSLNYDGTIHDKLGGIPKLTRAIRNWLEKNGWKGN